MSNVATVWVMPCFNMSVPHVHKGKSSENPNGLLTALTSSALNTCGMNWNTNCEPGLIAQDQCPDFTNALLIEWNQPPAARFQHLAESLPRRGKLFIAVY